MSGLNIHPNQWLKIALYQRWVLLRIGLALGMMAAILLHFTDRADIRAATQPEVRIVRIATNLENPRGVAVYEDGRLLVIEAGNASEEVERGGHISLLSDTNADGDFDDADEREVGEIERRQARRDRQWRGHAN